MVGAAVVRGLRVVVAEAVRGAGELCVGVGLLLGGAPVVVRLVRGSAPGAPLVDPGEKYKVKSAVINEMSVQEPLIYSD